MQTLKPLFMSIVLLLTNGSLFASNAFETNKLEESDTSRYSYSLSPSNYYGQEALKMLFFLIQPHMILSYPHLGNLGRL